MDGAHVLNARVIEQFHAGVPVEGMLRERLLLLTTVGRRTGTPRTTPMMFHRYRGRLLVMASNAGAAKAPDWYVNLVAHPRVIVEAPDATYDAIARTLIGADRAAAGDDLVRAYPFFADHQLMAGPVIPLVELVGPSTTGLDH
jgi:deazaflavin-dependent oxidoreductase (nitroreductase family)